MTGIPDDAGRVCEVNESIRLLQHRDGLTFGTDAGAGPKIISLISL